jgi:L-2,4-diaminobutyrate decarboxylase
VSDRAPGEGLLAGGPGSAGELARLAGAAAEAVEAAWAAHGGPWSGADPAALRAAVEAIDPCPPHGSDAADVLRELGATVLAHGIRPGDPRSAAHLHVAPLLASAAAELAIGATNQSMDSFDQAPAATLVEDRLTRWLAALLGLADGATGVFCTGGTSSNLHGLLLARDAAARRAGIAAPRIEGLPASSSGWRILASEAAHFSVRRAAAVLGLGARSVLAVAVDEDDRMDADALRAALEALAARGEQAIAIVATAGTTDAGAIDPLDAIADLAAASGAWLHVDAAVGAGLALSPRLARRLSGIGRADSVTVDLHKLFWQPISASALIVADPAALSAVREPSAYLDREDDDGMLNLVARSLDTSRRFDAFKVLVGLRCVGRTRIAAMVEHVVALAVAAGEAVAAHPDLELLVQPQTVMVLLRWRPAAGALDDGALDAANTALQRALFASGEAIVGRTVHRGRVALKLTLVNPAATIDDIHGLLALVVAAGAAAER